MRKIDLTGIKNLVFDLGGVIITLDRDEAVRRFVEAGAKDAAERLNPYHQNGIFLELEEGKLSREEFYEVFWKETGSSASKEAIDAGWLGFMKDVPVAKLRLLERLNAEGYRLYLLSNTNPVIMEWALSSDFSADRKPLDAYFDKLYLSYQLKCVKPDPAIFQKMIADSGLIPSETLFLDDGAANVQMGEQLGFRTYLPVNGEDFTPLFY
ncbi:MAG: HAD family phosphatase [Dysgonamonadaceae bacterium]|jgi:putative hydrolase of the HAD superfamily|nr:HAD family phosphatase [Dysgonamonadaceae bacterium]